MKMERRPKAIDKLYKRRDRIDMPEYQRQKVWPAQKKRLLIDTILKGWRLPKFYFVKLDDNNFDCVDGQQRLSAIWDFFEGKLALDEGMAARYGGATYEELRVNSPDISDNFDDYEIDIEEIEDASEDELEELFKRLQLGTPLNTPEKLNAISGGVRRFAQHVIGQPFFSQKLQLKNTRYAHYDIAVRWVYLEARGIEQRTRLADLESFMRENRTFSPKSSTAITIAAALDYLNQAFPSTARVIRNKANALSVLMLASRVIRQELHRDTAPIFGDFVNDFFRKLAIEVEKGIKSKEKDLLAYQEAIRAASAEGQSIKTRLDILTKRLATFTPKFSVLLGAYQEAANSAAKGVSQEAEAISTLLYDVNRKHTGMNGEDLFKMTNKTAAALRNLHKPRTEQKEFEKLIDDLYFLIYEGSGSCKRLPAPVPDFAMDVKFLRTAVRHDVDHGSPNDVAKKEKRAAAVFKHYSGKTSIGECGPEELLATQFRILKGARSFLESLI